MTRGRGRVSVAVGAVSALLTFGGGSPAGAATVFRLADDSTVVARGVVQGVQTYKNDGFLVFAVSPQDVLKGGAEKGKSFALVQERVFGTEKPYYTTGATALVFAVPLPPYTHYKKSLPAGAYLRWTDTRDSPAEIAALADPAVLDAVRGYLAVQKEVPACARHLAGLLGSPVARLRADALATIAERPELAAALDGAALDSLHGTLSDEHIPVGERTTILVTLARKGAPGVGPIAARIFAEHGPLQAAALDALVLVNRMPDEEQLLAASRSDDPVLRAAAVRGLARSSSRAAFERTAAIVTGDPVQEVRTEALKALGSAHDPRAVGILAQAMRGTDKGQVQAAGESLGRIRSPEAIRALGEVLRQGTFDAEAAAAFSLLQTNDPAAFSILRDQRDQHPDPQVRRVIKITLGEHLDDHDD